VILIASRRQVEVGFQSLPPYLIAPALAGYCRKPRSAWYLTSKPCSATLLLIATVSLQRLLCRWFATEPLSSGCPRNKSFDGDGVMNKVPPLKFQLEQKATYQHCLSSFARELPYRFDRFVFVCRIQRTTAATVEYELSSDDKVDSDTEVFPTLSLRVSPALLPWRLPVKRTRRSSAYGQGTIRHAHDRHAFAAARDGNDGNIYFVATAVARKLRRNRIGGRNC